MLKTNSYLTELNLSSNWLNDQGIIEISKALEQNYSIKTLILNNVQLSKAGVEFLASKLKNRPNLKGLHISDNQFGDSAGVSILNIVPTLEKLKYLSLSFLFINIHSISS